MCLVGGRVADVAVTLDRSDGRRAIQAILRGYPRWSEPLTGLVARCLGLVADESDISIQNDLRLATLSISLERWVLAEVHLIPEHGATSESGPLQPIRGQSSISLWSLVQRRLAHETRGMPEVPPLPAPIRIPVYHHGAIPYCRTRDLPADARVVFAQWAFGRKRPVIPKVEDAVHASDLEAFLG